MTWWRKFLDLSREKQKLAWKKLSRRQKNEIKVRTACFGIFKREPWVTSSRDKDKWMEWAVKYLSPRDEQPREGETSWHTIVAHYPEKGYRTQVRIQLPEKHEAPHTISIVDGSCVAMWGDREESAETLGELCRSLKVINGLHLVRTR